MMKTFKYLFLGIFVNISHISYSQLSDYKGQISNSSTLYNPSFVGSKNDLRVGVGTQFRSYQNTNYSNSFLSIDAPIKKISAAFGISGNLIPTITNQVGIVDTSGYKSNATFNAFAINATYVQIFTIRNIEREEIISIRPSLTLSYNKTDIMYSYHLNESFGFGVVRCDIIPSILFSSEKYFIGLSYHNNVITSNSHLYRLNLPEHFINLITGYNFQRKKSKFSFTPIVSFNFYKSPSFESSLNDINLTFKYGKFLAGINYNGFMVGYQTDNVRVCFSGVKVPNETICELSLNYIFKKPKR